MIRPKIAQTCKKKKTYDKQRIFEALFFHRDVKFCTDNVRASMTNSMSAVLSILFYLFFLFSSSTPLRTRYTPLSVLPFYHLYLSTCFTRIPVWPVFLFYPSKCLSVYPFKPFTRFNHIHIKEVSCWTITRFDASTCFYLSTCFYPSIRLIHLLV